MNTHHQDLIKKLFSPILEEELIDELLASGKIQTFKEGEIVIDVNQTITHIPLMLDGSIKIMREDEDGKEMFLYYIESGSTCAASLTCCMNQHKSNILAIVEEDATFVSMSVNYMDQWMAKYKSWRNFILSNYANRYDELLEVVGLLAFKKMDDRVINYLQEKAATHNSDTIIASHQKIAIDLNSSREVISRVLKQMERKGMLTLKRGQILLHNNNE
jgi:CRP/FNR family transcriptional regulator